MRTFLLLLLSAATAFAQTAKVTFYAPGSVWKGAGKNAATLGIGKDHEAASQGQVYMDGERQVVLWPGKYATIEVPAGPHEFTTSKPGKENDSPLSLVAEANQHYFLRLTTTSSGAWIVQKYSAHLSVATCAEARLEADTTKPLAIRWVDKPVRDKLIDSTYFPRCQ